MNNLFLAAGVLCVAYYLACGFGVRFGQSMLWVWLVLGLLFLARYALVRVSVARGVPLPYPAWLICSVRVGCAALLAVFLVVEGVILAGSGGNCPANVDYLLILGAKTGSVTIEGRTAVAAEYLKNNPETIAIATGGKGTDEQLSEGAYIRKRLIELGIDESRILLEDRSSSTVENMRFARALIAEEDASIGIVSNDYHVFRAKGLARKVFSGEIYGLPMRSKPLTFPHYMMREFFAVAADALAGNMSFGK